MKREDETISKIFSNDLGEKVLTISPIIGKGFVNQVFLVKAESSAYIFRRKLEDSLDEYQKEEWAAQQAREREIPTPQILKIGVFDHQAYSIQQYVEGIEGRNFPADKRFIWKQLGEYARKIQQIKVGGFGLRFCDLTQGNSQKFWLRYLDYNIESLNDEDQLLKLGVLTLAQSKTVRNIFENLRFKEFQFGLNHGDLSLKNTIVDDQETVHLIDWGSAEASIIPHHDLIQLLKVQMQENNPDEADFKAFLDGYEISEEEYEQLLPELQALELLRAFDKLRWAIDWKIPELKEYVSLAQETVEKYLK